MEAIDHLLDRACQGESEALSLLYRHFLPGIFGYIAARVPQRVLAEDLTSEVFLKMVEGISQFRARDEASFTAWLLQIARMTVAGYYRKQENRPVLLPLEPAGGEEELAVSTNHPESNPARYAEARDDWRQTVQAINALTEDQRQVLVGRLILGYDIATVARIVGKKPNAIKALQFRALNSLQRLLKQQESAHQLCKEERR